MLGTCPPGAPAKPAKQTRALPGLFGVTIWEPPTVEEFQRMSMGGVSHVRLIFFPGVVEQQRGQRDWRLYDKLIGDAARGGISVDPMFYGVPSWMSSNPSTLPIWTPAQQAFWFSFVRDAARRYGPGGAFWSLNPGLPRHPLADWELWNEPNIDQFTGNRVATPGQYAQLLRITRAGLNAAGPDNHIVLGGLYRKPPRGHGTRATRFLQRLYKLPKGRSLFDAVAIHPYAARPRQVLGVTESIRRVMNANHDARKPLWITELGWTTGGNFWAQSHYRTTPDQQATRIAGVARLLIAHTRELKLRRINWHTWRDYPSGDNFWDKFMGFFTADGRPKPSWVAFTQLTGGFTGGQIRNVGREALPPGPGPAPGGGGTPPSQPTCLLPGILC
jgi:hypothetical protein